MKTILIGVALVSVLFTVAGIVVGQDNDAVQHEERVVIETMLTNYEKALNASDVEAVLKLYAEDGVFMPSGAPTATGAVELRGAYEHVFATIKLDIRFTIDEVVVDGDFAFARTVSRGKVTILADEVTAPEENRELFVFRKREGEWRIARYIFNKMS